MSAAPEADPSEAEKAAYFAAIKQQAELYPAADTAVDLLSRTLIAARACRAVSRLDRGTLDEPEKAELRRLAATMHEHMTAAMVAVGELMGKVGDVQ